MNFDELLDKIGSFGRYQKLGFFVIGFAAAFAAFNNMSIVFLAATPNHWCHVKSAARLNLTDDILMNLTIPLEEKNGKLTNKRCKMYDLNYTTMTSQQVDDILRSDRSNLPERDCDSWQYDRSIYKETIVTQWDVVCGDDWLAATATSVYMAGLMVGVLLYGSLADKIGRRKTVLIALVVGVSVNIGIAFSPNLLTFIILRFIVAVNTIGLFTTAFVMVVEMVGPEWRVFTGIAIEYFWAGGYMLVAGVAYALRDWRHLQLALSVPAVLLFVYFFVLPESPRWLYAMNRHEEGEKLIRKMAKFNKAELPEKLEVAMQKEQKAFIIDLVRTPNLRKKSLNIFYNWFVNSLVYYGLSLNTSNLGGNDYINFLLSAAVEVPAYIFCQISLSYLGRRWPMCGTMVAAGVFLLVTLAVPSDLNWLIITLATAGKFAITASFGIIYVFSAEIYPTVVRSVGIGASSFCARIGGIIAPFVNQQLGKLNPIIPTVLFGVCSITAGLLILLLPETKGQNMPDTIEEGEEIGKKHKDKGVEAKAENGVSNPTFQEDAYL